MTHRLWLITLILIVAVGVWLRFYRLGYGLPDVVDVDAFKFVGTALLMVSTGNWEPRDFQYPGLYANLLAVLYWLLGIETDWSAHLLGRAVSATFGVALIGVTYWTARRVTGLAGAMLAAALATFCVGAVTISRIACPDILTAVFATAALGLLVRLPVSRWGFLAAGGLIGLATAAKYNGAFAGVILVLSALMTGFRLRKPSRAIIATVLGAGAAALVFWAATPWILDRWDDYRERFRLETAVQQAGQIGHVQAGYFDYLVSATPTWEQPWLGTSLLVNLGPVVLFLGLLAVILAITGRFGYGPAALAIYFAAYLALITGPGHVKAFRFLLPVLPSLFILAGWGWERFFVARLGRWRGPLLVASVAIILAVPAYRSTAYVLALRHVSTNSIARHWLAANVPDGSRVLLSPFFLDDYRHTLPGMELLILPDVGSRQYGLPHELGRSPEREPIYYAELVDAFEGRGVDYVVLNSYFDDSLSDVVDNRRWFPRSVEEYLDFRRRLDQRGELVFEVRGWEAGRPGPDITVYRLPSAGDSSP